MIDTNVLISAVYNSDSTSSKAIAISEANHLLVFCEYVIDECREVIGRKFPHRLELFETLIRSSKLEIVTGEAPYSFPVSDPKDQPILDAAVEAGIDILISGDKHFFGLGIEKPEICTPVQFLKRVGYIEDH